MFYLVATTLCFLAERASSPFIPHALQTVFVSYQHDHCLLSRVACQRCTIAQALCLLLSTT